MRELLDVVPEVGAEPDDSGGLAPVFVCRHSRAPMIVMEIPGACCVHSRTTHVATRDTSATLPALATPTVGSGATRPTKMDHRLHGHALRRASARE